MKTKYDLYIQLWILPITNGQLLNVLGPEELHTFVALSAHINKSGWCNPSLKTLKRILGLSDIGTVSKRIKKLENLEFEGKPILKVERTRKPNDKGILVYANNRYILNPTIATIFVLNATSTDRRIQQMKELTEIRSDFAKSFALDTKRNR